MGSTALDTTSIPPTAPQAQLARLWRGERRCGNHTRWTSRHGYERVERLDGNIGYIDIRRFEGSAAARATAIAAMAQLAGVVSLVLDVSRHRGGDAAMAALLTSLLFDTEPLYTDELYLPSTAPVAPSASEPRFTAQHVTVLVSPETSAAGVAFAANLERLGRATFQLVPPAEHASAARADA